MKVLTVRQPWATLIVTGTKTIETRPFGTSYRGPVAILAGATVKSMQVGDWNVEKDGPGQALLRGPAGWPYRLPFGALLGVVDLVDVAPIVPGWDCPRGERHVAVRSGDSPSLHLCDGSGPEGWQAVSDQLPLGDFAPGRNAWLLEDPRRLRSPIPAKGTLGLRDLDPALEALVLGGLAA